MFIFLCNFAIAIHVIKISNVRLDIIISFYLGHSLLYSFYPPRWIKVTRAWKGPTLREKWLQGWRRWVQRLPFAKLVSFLFGTSQISWSTINWKIMFSKVSDESYLRPILLGLCKEWRIVNLNSSKEWAVWWGKGWNCRRVRTSPNRTASDCLRANGLVMARNLTLMKRCRRQANLVAIEKTWSCQSTYLILNIVVYNWRLLWNLATPSQTWIWAPWNLWAPEPNGFEVQDVKWFSCNLLGMFPEKAELLVICFTYHIPMEDCRG